MKRYNKYINKLSDRYGEGFANVFKRFGTYNPNEKDRMTIGQLKKKYSRDAALLWLKFHIAITLDYCDLFAQTSLYQVGETARMMLASKGVDDTPLIVILHFFYMIKAGFYGDIKSCRDILHNYILYVNNSQIL